MSKFAPLNEAFFSKPVHSTMCPMCGHINMVSGELPPVVTCSHPMCNKQFMAVEYNSTMEEDDNASDLIDEMINNDDWGN